MSPRQSRRRSATTWALALTTFVLYSGTATAQVIVAEDFLYKQPTNTEPKFDTSNKFTASDYGGGQNGIGVWDERWAGFGAGGIVSDGADVTNPLFVANPYVGAVSNSASGGVGATLLRQYATNGALAGANTIWFAADIRMNTASNSEDRYVGFSPFTTGDPFTSALQIGSRNDVFFAQIGNTVVEGDFNTPADRTDDDQFHRIVGKLELNAGAAIADYNGNGFTDAADYTIWRDTLGSTSDLRADGNGSGTIDQPDYDLWAGNYGVSDRLTVYIDPTGPNASAGSTLVVDGPLFSSAFDESADPDVLTAYITGNNPDAGGGDAPAHSLVDNFVIGLSYDDVAQVDVPRLTAQVGPGGALSLVNNSGEDIELVYYEVRSASGSIDAAGWNSLTDQMQTGWAENASSSNLLVESNLFGETVLAGSGASVSLGTLLASGGTQDFVVRYGVLGGGEGLLNLAPVVAAASTAVPEPTAGVLLAIAVLALAKKRD